MSKCSYKTALAKAKEELERQVDKGRIENAEQADERATELVYDVADECRLSAKARDKLLAAMMLKVSREFPGEW